MPQITEVLTPVTKTVAIVSGTSANVANVVCNTNTFHLTNASTTVYAYVGIFKTYAEAVAMDHPTAGTDGFGVLVVPNTSLTLQGNFGTGGIVGGTV
jgi:hypothetical protein